MSELQSFKPLRGKGVRPGERDEAGSGRFGMALQPFKRSGGPGGNHGKAEFPLMKAATLRKEERDV